MRFAERALRVFGLVRTSTAVKWASYAGASTSRLFGDWVAGIMSPDRKIRGSLRLLRARARQLVDDNSYAAGFITELADNIVGPDGIQLQARVRDIAGNLKPATNYAIEDAWKEWSNPEFASIDGRCSWPDLEALAIRTLAVDGEVFFRLISGASNAFGFAVQVLDADLLDETFERSPGEDGSEVRMGIEMDRFGKPIAYHFWRRHPSERGHDRSIRERIPADQIIHLYLMQRPGQSRGPTWFAPVLADIHMLGGLTQAELVATRVSAAKMGFIVNKSEAAIDAWTARMRMKFERADEGDDDEGGRGFDASPGVIDELAPGQEFQGFDPTHPSTAFEPFVKTILQGIARGLGTTYARLTGDLSSVNYSSMRSGELPVRDRYRSIQKWLYTHLHRRVYRAWLPMALASGMVRVDSRLSSDFRAVAWKPRGWKSVDPLKEVQALQAEIELGIASRTSACADRGIDYEETIDELAEEQRYADQEGVSISGVSNGQTGPPSDDDGDDPAEPADRLALAM